MEKVLCIHPIIEKGKDLIWKEGPWTYKQKWDPKGPRKEENKRFWDLVFEKAPSPFRIK